MRSDNPSARLFSILENGKKISSTSKCRAAWQELLNVDPSDHALLMSRLGKMMELPDQIINTVKSDFPNQLKTCNHWKSQVTKAFMTQDLNGQWATFIGQIDGHALNYLNITTELLQTTAITKLLNDEELSELRDSINKLLQETVESDIPDDIKKYVTGNLHKMLLHIDEYTITGAQPIMDSVDIMFGHAFSNDDYRNYLSGNDLGVNLVNTLTAVAATVTIVLGVPQLPEAFSNILKLVQK
ncbi:MAG: hypothetical protein KAT04_12490 [Methylococcales bacterium]|nr:hypothetical protein [Methylococcales bacterium]